MSREGNVVGRHLELRPGDAGGPWPQPSGGFAWTQAPWGEVLVCGPLTAAAPHLFTTANLRLVEDEREWDAIAAHLGLIPGNLRLVRQVHGTSVAVVRRGARGGAERPEADIVISDDPDAAVAVRVADCAPVLLADTRLGVVGAAHAGWRGTVRRAAAVAVAAMEGTFGTRPADLIAAIGPCLGPCCGEVGPEVLEMFRAEGHPPTALERWFAPGPSGRPHLDLWRANADQLADAGVQPERIFTAELCTRTHHALLHSYRAHGSSAGRSAALIRARG